MTKTRNIYDAPDNWDIVRLENVSDVIMGQSPDGATYNTERRGTPLLNGPTEFGSYYPTAIQYTTAPSRLCRPEDVLVCVRGSTTGRMNVADKEYCIGRGLAAIRAISNKTDSKWLYYELLRNQTKIYDIASGGGTTFPNINRETLASLSIFQVPIAEQQNIASILFSVDILIQKTDEIIEQTQRLKRGLMQRLLTKGVVLQRNLKTVKFAYRKKITIPEEWQVVKINSLVRNKSDIKTGPFGSSLKKEFFVSKGYKVYGQEQVISDNFEIGNYYIPEELFVKMKDYEIHPRDVLISLVGTHGKISIVPNNIERGIINPRLLKVTFDQSIALPEFMKVVLSSELTNIQIQGLSHGLTMDILNLGLMKKLIFFLPPLDEQQKIVEIISIVDGRIEELRKCLESLYILKKGLMQKLLTGQIRVKV